jgi:predicted ArsR family transcriptional regulator
MQWMRKISSAKSLAERVTVLSELRDSTGAFSRCKFDSENGLRIEEYHNPLQPVFEVYPNAVRMEIQMMEQLLGTRVVRREVSSGKGRKHLVYEVATLASAPERPAAIDRRALLANRAATAPAAGMRPVAPEGERPATQETASQTFLEG